MLDKNEIIKKYNLDKETLVSFLRNIITSRFIDDAEIQMRKQNKAFFQISGAGHEGILTAVGSVLKPKHDHFICYYRDRSLCLRLGVTPYQMLCHANGNIGDISSQGRQMPAHFGHAGLNIISKSSNMGVQFNQAAGVAEAGKYLQSLSLENSPEYKEDEIIYVSTGDGTIAQGEFWEGLTTSIVNKLPVLFMIEDNGFAISTPNYVQMPEGSISKTLQNMPGLKVFECNGNCPIESYHVVKMAEEHLRGGKGPVLIHAHVTRPYSHSLSDDHGMYRTKAELLEEKSRDVFNTYPQYLLENSYLTGEEFETFKKELKEEVREAMKKALETPWPKVETTLDHLYSSEVDPKSSIFEVKGIFEGKADIPMATAINNVLKTEVAKNPLIRIFGQDVADFTDVERFNNPELKGKGGVFKVTHGVQKVGRPGQVFNSPLAEANIIGRAVGMAMRGLKPVVEIQFFDYIWPAFMELKNEMGTTRYRSAGTYKSPMVVRVPIGGYLRGGAMFHSQCGESYFTHSPGIYVAFPSNAKDAAGLLRTAIRCDDPVMFLEHKHLYYQGYNRTADPGPDFMIPFGKANIIQEGTDATVLCWGAMVQKSIEAARVLSKEGYSIEVIDLRTLNPLDMETITKSLCKTNRILIAHEENKTSGFAGEIAARINEESFEALDAPIMRVTAKDCHVPYNPDQEDFVLPQIPDVTQKLRSLLNY